MLLITSHTWPIEGVASSDPFVQHVFICSVELRKTRDVISPGAVDVVVVIVSCDGTRFANFLAVSEGRQHGADDSVVDAIDPASVFGYR